MQNFKIIFQILMAATISSQALIVLPSNQPEYFLNKDLTIKENKLEKFKLSKDFLQKDALNPNQPSHITGIAQGKMQNVYIGLSNDGLWKRSTSTGSFSRINLNLSDNRITFVKNLNGTIYFAVGGSLGYLDENDNCHYYYLEAKEYINIAGVGKIQDIAFYKDSFIVLTDQLYPIIICPIANLNDPESWVQKQKPIFNLGGVGGLCLKQDIHNDSVYAGTNGSGLYVNKTENLEDGFEKCYLNNHDPKFSNARIKEIIDGNKGDLYCSTGENYLGYYGNNLTINPKEWRSKEMYLPKYDILYQSIGYDIDGDFWNLSRNNVYSINLKNEPTIITMGIEHYDKNFISCLASGMIFISAEIKHQHIREITSDAYLIADYSHYRNNFPGIVIVSIWLSICIITFFSVIIYLYLRSHNKLPKFKFKKKLDKF